MWFSAVIQNTERAVLTASASAAIPHFPVIHSTDKNTFSVHSKVPMFSGWLRQ